MGDAMRLNTFSYWPTDDAAIWADFETLSLDLSPQQPAKEALRRFVDQHFYHYQDKDFAVHNLLADWETDLLTFFQSDRPLTAEIFQMVALELLGFIPHMDFTVLTSFVADLGFEIDFDATAFHRNLHQLLATRRKDGVTLVDFWVNQGLLPTDNHYHYFNGKSLATFEPNDFIREVVYVETPLDTDKDGQLDLVKVAIIRPKASQPVPVMMTASPYHMGVNEVASDKKLYKMEGELEIKPAGQIKVQPSGPLNLPPHSSDKPESEAEETFSYLRSFTLNDYFLPRGFATIYVSGIGTAGSTGFMTSGDYQQIEGFKAVIDWLNGRRPAFTSHRRDKQVKATWANGKVATTGISYLGTMSTGLATTGVDGLEVIISEAGISSWYEYYRENGLVSSPGGYPGEDLDSLAELTYSRNLIAGDYLRHNAHYQEQLQKDIVDRLDRETGDYSQFWEDRNYLPHADKIKATVIYTHGLQDWNVKPRHVYKIFNALPSNHDKHLFLHQGDHINMHNWQSIDFRESLLTLLSDKLLGQKNTYELATVIWQDNSKTQTWRVLSDFGSQKTLNLPLGEDTQSIQNHYPQETFDRYSKAFQSFKTDLFDQKAHSISLDLPVEEDLLLNGPACLNLRVKSSTNKGLLSAQLLDYGQKKQPSHLTRPVQAKTVDYGRGFSRDNLDEIPHIDSPYRVITKGYLNLQNRTNLCQITTVPADDWLDIKFELQPSLYQLKKGDKLRLVLYTTDFEHTIRDNSDYELTIDLANSTLQIPYHT